jgi:hypothetical protein
MTRSSARANADSDIPPIGGKPSPIRGTLFLIMFIGMFWAACSWMLSDVTGEYSCQNNYVGQVRLSLVRKAANVKGELSYGSGSFLEMVTPNVVPDQEFQWTFSTPEKWVEKGQRKRYVKMTGTIKDGTVTAKIYEGRTVTDVTLARSGMASVYRQFQSHMPWVE